MNLKNQPVIDFERTAFARFLDFLAIIVFSWVMIYLILQWSALPEEVPMHFDASGVPDGSGPGWTIYLLPLIGFALWLGMAFLEKRPQIHNYLNLTEENMEKQYRNSSLLVNVMKNQILIFFSYLSWEIFQLAQGARETLGWMAVPGFMVVLFGSIFFFIVRSLRMR
ncbi:MAG TPA: DUF1648 domain-containing protein [Planococcus sp. (in: firmicutes)]|nr:DUF1648 domain-containing protein [Planococcus sp. (in: firmicutes)]